MSKVRFNKICCSSKLGEKYMKVKAIRIFEDDKSVEVLINGKTYKRKVQWKIKRDKFGNTFSFPYVVINKARFLLETKEKDVW